MKLFLFTLLLPLLTCSAFAKAEHSCMYRHLDDAMILNHSRAPHYRELSGGQSTVVSEAMISFEKRLIRTAGIADAVALPLHLQGIPILCVDYVSMSETPAFRTTFKNGPPSMSQFKRLPVQPLKDSLNLALKYNDFDKMVEISTLAINELEKEPRFNCMVRHFLESLRRIAGLAPQYQMMAESKLSSATAKFLSKRVLSGHIQSLDEATHIDLLAAPVQAMNIPMVCQDVPHIPVAPNLL